jgi:hypothetical protein
MTDQTTPGVLLKGEDGSHYFIPHAEMSRYAVSNVPDEVSDGVAQAAPKVNAFSVERASGGTEAAAAFYPMPEG